MKDVLWRPLVVTLGAFGLVAGAASGALGGGPLIAAAAGAALPTLVALSSVGILCQARRR